MIDWDKKLIKKMEDLELLIPLYSRFKDDILIASKAVENGTKLVDDRLIVDTDKKKDDEGKNAFDVTMGLVKEIGD